MKAQLVAETAPPLERFARRQQCGQRTDRIGAASHLSHGVADRAHVRRAAVGERLDRTGKVVTILGWRLLVPVEHRRQQIGDVRHRQLRDVHHLESGRRVTKQAVGTCHVSRGQHEAVRTGGEATEQVREHVAKPRKALERTQLEHFVQEKGAWTVAGSPGCIEESEKVVEGASGAARRALSFECRKRRRCGDRFEKPFGGRRRAFDVDVLCGTSADAFSHAMEEPGSSGSAAAQYDRDSRGRRVKRPHHPSLKACERTHWFSGSTSRDASSRAARHRHSVRGVSIMSEAHCFGTTTGMSTKRIASYSRWMRARRCLELKKIRP